jgi:hypothetical protein
MEARACCVWAPPGLRYAAAAVLALAAVTAVTVRPSESMATRANALAVGCVPSEATDWNRGVHRGSVSCAELVWPTGSASAAAASGSASTHQHATTAARLKWSCYDGRRSQSSRKHGRRLQAGVVRQRNKAWTRQLWTQRTGPFWGRFRSPPPASRHGHGQQGAPHLDVPEQPISKVCGLGTSYQPARPRHRHQEARPAPRPVSQGRGRWRWWPRHLPSAAARGTTLMQADTERGNSDRRTPLVGENLSTGEALRHQVGRTPFTKTSCPHNGCCFTRGRNSTTECYPQGRRSPAV